MDGGRQAGMGGKRDGKGDKDLSGGGGGRQEWGRGGRQIGSRGGG